MSQVHIDTGNLVLTGSIAAERILQSVGQEPTLIFDINLKNETRPFSDPRPCFFYVSPDKSTGAQTYGVKRCSAFNDQNWNFPTPIYIQKGHLLRMYIYGETSDIVGFQYSANQSMRFLEDIQT